MAVVAAASLINMRSLSSPEEKKSTRCRVASLDDLPSPLLTFIIEKNTLFIFQLLLNNEPLCKFEFLADVFVERGANYTFEDLMAELDIRGSPCQVQAYYLLVSTTSTVSRRL